MFSGCTVFVYENQALQATYAVFMLMSLVKTSLDCEQSVLTPQILGANGNVIIMQIRCENASLAVRGYAARRLSRLRKIRKRKRLLAV